MEGTNITYIEVDDLNPKRISTVKSPTDIDWQQLLHGQLWPQLEGHPTSGKSDSDFKVLRKQIPVLIEEQFNKIFQVVSIRPSHSSTARLMAGTMLTSKKQLLGFQMASNGSTSLNSR